MSIDDILTILPDGVINVGSAVTFNKLVHQYKDNLIVVTFSSPNCRACQTFLPIFGESQKLITPEGVIFAKVTVQDLPEVALQFKISATPTTIFIYQQRVIHRQLGGLPQFQMNELIRGLLNDVKAKK